MSQSTPIGLGAASTAAWTLQTCFLPSAVFRLYLEASDFIFPEVYKGQRVALALKNSLPRPLF